MAIAKVQSSPVVTGVSVTTTFASLPTPGNLIVVPIISFSQSSPQAFTVTDNQGNTYHKGADSGNFNGSNTFIYYAYNVNSSGTFTITVTMTGGSGSHGESTLGIEYSGFGGVDPLVGNGGANNVNPPSCTTGTTGAAEVAVVAAMSTFRLNFDITAITVNSTSPVWIQEYERLSAVFLDLAGEIDSRVVSGGGAQAVSWTITSTAPGSPSCAIAAFFGTPPIADLLNYQTSRSVLELADTTSINLYQVSRQVMYPFTCTPGPPPPPPGVTGCVDELSDLSADCSDGCVPEI